MEKDIFKSDLNSMMGGEAPIEVDGTEDSYMNELFFEDSEIEPSKDKSKVQDMSSLIDVSDTKEDSDEELEEVDSDIENESIEEEPSSAQKPKADASKSSPLTPYAKLLKDEGVLPELDLESFDGKADTLKEAMFNQVVNMVESYKQSLPPRVQQLIDNYEDGVPFEKLLELDSTESYLESVNTNTLSEDIDLQKKIVKDYLKKTTKFSDAKINSTVDYYEDSGELESEAENSYAELKSSLDEEKNAYKESARKADEDRVKDREKMLDNLNDTIMKTKEIIPGVPLSEAQKKSLYQSLTVPVGKDQHGNMLNKIVKARMEDPLNFEIKLHYLFDITKGFSDFSKMASKGKKDSIKEFEDAVQGIDSTKSGYSRDSAQGTRVKDKLVSSILKTYNI